MDISALITGVQDFAPELLKSYCIVNGNIIKLDELQNMGYEKFSLYSKKIMPLRLYRYYPNLETVDKNTGKADNYSIQVLEENTVFLQTPTAFDDVYDSDINVDYSIYERLRLIEYCKRCGLNVNENQPLEAIGNVLAKTLYDYYRTNNSLDNVFIKKPSSEIENLTNQLFLKYVLKKLDKTRDFSKAVANAIQSEYSDYIASLKNTFRISCFATTPYSQLMWGGSYANCHRGFCIEYTVLPDAKEYEELYFNLYPVIYCKTRPDTTAKLVAFIDKNITKEALWDIYFNGILRKSIDWFFQNEWRLLLPFRRDNDNYNVKFFPITKVYLGNRMEAENRKKIIEICNQKNIPYVGIKKSSQYFEMQDCETKCENCPQLHKLD
ncbi:MAG: DUF2971 domain-containing protein [Clostridia bacterium]|nr:DUF2971 domain-containing protein [Clostridia bacterium]